MYDIISHLRVLMKVVAVGVKGIRTCRENPDASTGIDQGE